MLFPDLPDQSDPTCREEVHHGSHDFAIGPAGGAEGDHQIEERERGRGLGHGDKIGVDCGFGGHRLILHGLKVGRG